MTIDRIFYSYMAFVGVVSGTILIVAPAAGDLFIKPYFWILIAVAIFELATSLYRQTALGPVMPMQTRLIGFAIGIAAMVTIPTLAGSSASFV